MPLIGGNTHFYYNGKSSKEFGLISVQIGSGMYEDTLVASRSLEEIKLKNQDESILQRIDEDVREFPLTIAFERKFTMTDIDNVILWLFQDSYKPFYFEDQPNRVQYAMPSGDSGLIHNGLKQGYITLTMRTNSSKVYSQKKTSVLETVATSKTITYQNGGHEIILPEISIVKNGAGKITIENLDDSGAIFEVKNLANGEDIYLDSKREIIETDIVGVYHYEDVLGDFPKLVRGQNRWKVTGPCTIQLRYSEKYKF